MACADCHPGARASRAASDDLVPGMEICRDCHEPSDREPEYARAGVAPFDSVNAALVAAEIIFSHEAHGDRDLDCGYCHGTDQAMALEVKRPSMDICLHCHEGRRGADDCAICHLRIQTLVPADHDAGWGSHHGEEARQDDDGCLSCHNEDHCQECHEGGRPLPAGPRQAELFLPYGPQVAAPGLLVERAHDLNYRYTHPLDAGGKESECAACHSYESFCSDCHAPADDPDRFKPLWHGGPGWGAFPGGVGTGGGRHGEMARRDIELCAACHEIAMAGTDPTCLECHSDVTPGRGNDPSTHDSGFAGDLGKGEWHGDDGAICFICHARSEAGDGGFCGYCHDPQDDEHESRRLHK